MPAPKRILDDAADLSIRKKKKSGAPNPTSHSVGIRPEEEFKRGGGSTLTPLEKRQIEAKAKRDVLFEQQSAKRRSLDQRPSSGDEEIDARQPRLRKHRKLSEQSKQHSAKPLVGTLIENIRGLTFKRLVPGSQVLGRIIDVTRKDLALSLPNNLTGYVPLSAISNVVSAEVDEDDDDSEPPSLSAMFQKGQFLRACVVASTDTDRTASHKRRIELSIEPDLVNKGIQATDLVPHSMVQAEVTAIEDHGLIVALRMEESQITGFVPTKELNGREPESFCTGAVILCMVTESVKNARVVKLSMDENKLWSITKSGPLKDFPSIDVLAPGAALEFTVLDVTSTGIIGSAMGLAKVTVDALHSGAWRRQKDLDELYRIGSKQTGRIIWKIDEDGTPAIGVSMMDHLLQGRKATSHLDISDDCIPGLAISSVVDGARVLNVEPKLGLFLDIGQSQPPAFVHISRVSDEKVQQLSGSSGHYTISSLHRCRIVGFNAMDMLFLATMEQSVIDLPFLRLEDLQVGSLVNGTVESFVRGKDGLVGLLVKLSNSISGMAAKLHLSDVTLEHPEKKFKTGSSIRCRVLSVDLLHRRLKLTLKRSLVNSDAPVWQGFDDVKLGIQVPGTLISFVQGGAIIQFYGDLRGFLPVSQMSEAYLSDPTDAFRLGQVIGVQALSSDPAAERLVLTCRDQGGLTDEQHEAFTNLVIGSSVKGSVIEKSKDDLILRLNDHGLKARLAYEHLLDGSAMKVAAESKRTRIGQTLKDLIVIQKDADHTYLRVTNKQSLRTAFAHEKVPHKLEALHVGMLVTGYINNITTMGTFVSFGGSLTGLLPQPRSQLSSQGTEKQDLRPNSTIECRIAKVDLDWGRLLLSSSNKSLTASPTVKEQHSGPEGPNGRYETSGEPGNYTIGQLVQAIIVSKKETQLNVELSGGVQGRIDVSEAFNNWEEIKDRKHPLRQFHIRQEVSVRVLGIHDSRNHRFLPITHTGKAPVFELSLKNNHPDSPDTLMLSLDQIRPDSKWLCFVNNIKDSCLWVNLSPNVRGRIDALNVSHDASITANLPKNFPIGSAIRATVIRVDASSNRLDLTATRSSFHTPSSVLDVASGSVMPAKVTKVMDRSVFVQLSETVSGPIHVTNLADDFSNVDLGSYQKDQMLKVFITSIDEDGKKIGLSARPSRTEETSPPVVDRHMDDISEVKADDVLRGFVKNISNNGLFVSLAPNVDAFVHTRDISDSFIKQWQSKYKINDLVMGKVLSVEPALNRIQMSLKESVLDANYKPPITYNDVSVGDIATGKVRKIEEFGAFIVLDNSNNVSGLCHRSQMANGPVSNAKDILEEGDKVTVAVMKVDPKTKRISFSLKSTHADLADDSGQAFVQTVHAGDTEVLEDDECSEASATNLIVEHRSENESHDKSYEASLAGSAGLFTAGAGLSAGPFDWSGNAAAEKLDPGFESDSAASAQNPQRAKRKKSQIMVDRTAELDVQGPQSVADFERLLLGQPNSSYLWVSYMAHQLQHGEPDKARAVAERAVRTINHHSQDTATDALNAWIAYLNLENAHGDEEAVEEVFRRACEVNDPQEIYSRLVSIYIQSGHLEKADTLLSRMIKSFSHDPKVWLNYATFLFDSVGSPSRGRDLLERALQTLPKTHHVEITSKFAQIEYRSEHGQAERGRTLFEGLSAAFPKRLDIWDVRLDQEIKLKDHDQVRRLLTRVTSSELKPKKAKHFFKRWLDFEKTNGQAQDVAKVEARAAEYVKLREGLGGE